MKISKGMAVRLVVYPLIIGIVGWQACNRFQRQKAADEDAAEDDEKARKKGPSKSLEGKSRTFVSPDGKSIKYYELTPEEYEAEFGHPPPNGGAEAEKKNNVGEPTPKLREDMRPPQPNMR